MLLDLGNQHGSEWEHQVRNCRHKNKLASFEVTLVQNYYRTTGFKCRATSVGRK